MKLLYLTGKELSVYFRSPMMYVVVAVFLAMTGYFFYTDLSYFEIAGGRDAVQGLWQFFFLDVRLVLTVFIPILTMRLFAEEKRLGSLELLWTYPVRDTEIILGKYIASVLFLVFILVLLLPYPAVLMLFTKVDVAPVLSGFFGLLLLGAAFIACGLFVSSLTESQAVSAMVTFGILLVFWIIAWNAGAAEESVLELLYHVSVFDHFLDFARGVIDTHHLVFFLLFAFFFLFLTHCSLSSRKWRGLK